MLPAGNRQVPNNKHQITNKFQAPNHKVQTRTKKTNSKSQTRRRHQDNPDYQTGQESFVSPFGICRFAVWSLFVIWCLLFGAYSSWSLFGPWCLLFGASLL
jgi:hypothetical protein